MTNHKMLKLPFNLGANSNSNIEMHMPEADLLRKADIIIWDEAPMSPKYVLDICHKKLCEIMGNQLPFGGKIMLLGGDFRQVLPVKKYAIPAEVIDLCLKKSPLWKKFKVVNLVQNMRANKDEKEFAQAILEIGNGTANDEHSKVAIPDMCIAKRPLSEIVFSEVIKKQDWNSVSKRAILSPYNFDVDAHNRKVLSMMPGTVEVYESCDTQDMEDGVVLGEEVLKTYNTPNFPQSQLALKKNAIAIILRSLILTKGLCNGTRILIMEMVNRLLYCKIVSGARSGEEVFIPRIILTDDEHFPCKLHRKQFPIRLAFAMTINKSQGQTLDYVGLDLSKDVFSHGQLYVGISRVRSWNSLSVQLPKNNADNKVMNVVWKEVL